MERDVVGGAAHLWDCIPSKALIATGGELAELGRAHAMGITAEGRLDIDALRDRVASIEAHVQRSVESLLVSQDVRIVRGTGRLSGPHCVEVEHHPRHGGDRGGRRPDLDGITPASAGASRPSTASGCSRRGMRTHRRRSPSTRS